MSGPSDESVLLAILLTVGAATIDEIESVRADDVGDEKLRNILEVVQSGVAEHDAVPTLATIRDRLEETETPTSVDALIELSNVWAIGACRFEDQHARVVEAAEKRRLREALRKSTIGSTARQSRAQVLEEISALDDREAHEVNELSLADAAVSWLDYLQTDGGMGVRTGITRLDEMTSGLRPGTLTLLAARPGVGKTSAAIQWISNAMDQGIRSAFFSFEEPIERAAFRIAALRAGTSEGEVKEGEASGAQIKAIVRESLSIDGKIFIDDDPQDATVEDVARRIRRLKRRHDIGLVVLDYIQMLQTQNGAEARYLEVGAVSRTLRRVAIKLQIPVLAIAALNRKSEAREEREPKASDLRESGSLEFDADTILLIHRPGAEEPAIGIGQAEIIVAKNRAGQPGRVRLGWDGRRTRFVNATPAFAGVA